MVPDFSMAHPPTFWYLCYETRSILILFHLINKTQFSKLMLRPNRSCSVVPRCMSIPLNLYGHSNNEPKVFE